MSKSPLSALNRSVIMRDTFSEIRFNLYGDVLNLKTNINGKVSWREEKIFFNDIDAHYPLLSWLLDSIKPILHEMPLGKIGTVCPSTVYEKIGNIINICASVLKCTNDTITEYDHLKDCAERNDRILCIFDVNQGSRFKTVYERFLDADKNKIVHMDIDCGYDLHAREWKEGSVPMELPDLIETIQKERIKKFVLINHYLLQSYMGNLNLYMPALLSHLGIEYVTIDNDIYDPSFYGYPLKSFFHSPSADRFSFDPVYQEYWDRRYGLERIHYIVSPEYYDTDGKMPAPEEDAPVLVLSHCRLDPVKQNFESILFLLDQMDGDSIFTEVSLWYWSLRRMILEIMELDEFERIYYNNLIHCFYYSISQFIKYEAVNCIDSDRKIEIYGDKGWKDVFPEHYRNRYLSEKEMDEILMSNRYVYLCLNSIITYLDASGALFDSIRRNIPFINFPPLVKTPSLAGFRHVEYENKECLNYLISNMNVIVKNTELESSINVLKGIMIESTNSIVDNVVCEKRSLNEPVYEQHFKEHKVLLEQATQEYINRNEVLLRESFNTLFRKDSKEVLYDIKESKYFNREYSQRIWRMICEERNRAARTCASEF